MYRKLNAFFLCVLCFFVPPLQASAKMPAELPTAIDRAVGICLDLIAGQSPQGLGKFRKTSQGYARVFAENSPGVLKSDFRLNGSNQPRVDIFIKRDRVCNISTVRLDGNYARHLALLKAALERRGWTYKKGQGPNITKGDRLLSLSGSKRQRQGKDFFTHFIMIEWVRSGSRGFKRRY